MEYQKMYGILCRAASEALDLLPRTPENAAGRLLLQKALPAAEEICVSADEPEEE
jgi:hypothetical protein